jgi:glycosyltransferase involved in cell wall biosynthesis
MHRAFRRCDRFALDSRVKPAPTPCGQKRIMHGSMICFGPPGRGSGPCPAIWCAAPAKPAHAVRLIHRALRRCDRVALVRRQRRLLRPSGRCCLWPPGRRSGPCPAIWRAAPAKPAHAVRLAHRALRPCDRFALVRRQRRLLRPAGRLRLWPPGRRSGPCPAIWCVAPAKPAHAVCLIHRALRRFDRFALVRRQRRLLRPAGRLRLWPPGRRSGP